MVVIMKKKRKKISSTYNLKSINPKAAIEWHKTKNILKLEDVAPFSQKKAWWKCSKCNHAWEATIGNRANGTGCPECKTEKRVKKYRENKFASSAVHIKFPYLKDEWNEKKNNYKFTEILSGSHWKTWWICKYCKFEWKTEIRLRCNGVGCPKCSKKIGGEKTRKIRLNKSENFLKKYPNIALEWHPNLNGEKKPENYGYSSNKVFWWKCKNKCQ